MPRKTKKEKSRGDPVAYVDDHSIWGMRYDRWRVDAPVRGYYAVSKRVMYSYLHVTCDSCGKAVWASYANLHKGHRPRCNCGTLTDRDKRILAILPRCRDQQARLRPAGSWGFPTARAAAEWYVDHLDLPAPDSGVKFSIRRVDPKGKFEPFNLRVDKATVVVAASRGAPRPPAHADHHDILTYMKGLKA